RTSVVQELTDIGTAAAHAFKPCLRHQSERISKAGKPSLDLRISLDRAVEPQEIVHPTRMPVSRALRNPEKTVVVLTLTWMARPAQCASSPHTAARTGTDR